MYNRYEGLTHRVETPGRRKLSKKIRKRPICQTTKCEFKEGGRLMRKTHKEGVMTGFLN